jgi:Ca-activated chloride channel family protein
MSSPVHFNPIRNFVLAGTVSLLAACSTPQSKLEAPAEAPAPVSISMPMSVQAAPEPAAEGARERYAPLQENKAINTFTDSVSTFSIDVDTASYANVRRFIVGGSLPPAEAVRIEEMINYFDYSYAAPKGDEVPFSVTTEMGPTPWNTSSHLLHVGIKGYVPNQGQQPARNLVFLIDVSGSMDAPNKLDLLKKSFQLLVKQLTSKDRVAIVVYAGSSGEVLPSTPGDHGSEIIAALDRLSAGGSTNGGAGIQLAYSIAQKQFIKNGVNRVILATDGDFNVGPSSDEELKQLIKEKKRSGVGLTVLGFGMGKYNDSMLEQISNSGDGNAAYIDNLKEAQKVLVTDVNATLHTIARDTKIQIEFNPEQVSSYRLIGYENRMLNREDFKNDRVDAGDVGAGHSVTALYEITLNDELRYQPQKASTGQFKNELGFLKIRYKRPDESASRLMVHSFEKKEIRGQLRDTSDNFRFSAAVAAFGQMLRHSKYVDGYSHGEVMELAKESRGEDRFGYRGEFLELVKRAEDLK